jgi:transmembrane sensor
MNASREQITNEAAEWLLRLEEQPDTRTQADFVAWIKLSPCHLDEFLMVEAAYRTMHQADPARRIDLDRLVDSARAEVVSLDAGTQSAPQRSASAQRRKRLRPLMYAAGLAALAIVAVQMFFLFPPTDVFSTAVGEQRSFKLADGSLLHLNTASRARIDFSGGAREVELQQGEALFAVKQDAARPFRVVADGAVVQVVGTTFNVYRRDDRSLRISVVDGRIRIAAALLSAGEEVELSPGAKVTPVATPDLARTLAWRQRRLVFRETALASVVEQFNRYNNEPKLRINSPAIAQRRITATFNADEPLALTRFLQEDPSVELNPRGDAVLIEEASPDK